MISGVRKMFGALNYNSKMFFGKTPQFIKTQTVDYLLNQDTKPRKRTKTVCTIGPKTECPEMAGKLVDQGLSVARLNFSHGDHEEHRRQMVGVQEALKSRPHFHTSILMDTKGPQIRTGNNLNGEMIQLKQGQLLEITTDYSHPCTSQRISCSYPELPSSTGVGRKILIADGGISTIVKKIEGPIVTVQVQNDGKIGSRKNMCLPGCVVNLPTITELDKTDIIDFGLKYKVDYIAVSFVRHRKELDELRELLKEHDPEHGPNIQIISKIQSHEAVENLEEIIDGSDGVMVARGDLGMEIPIQKVVVLQKYISDRAINKGRFVICATQMLESMEQKPRPTRAEVSDITNSVYDLTDANMTSGETTNGKFPIECARLLRKIAQEAEAACDYKAIFNHRKVFFQDRESVGIISLSFELDCDFIFLETDSIELIHRISALRPKAYLIVFTDKSHVKNAVALNFGVYCYPVVESKDPKKFIRVHGGEYGIGTKQKVRIMSLEAQFGHFVSSRVHEIN